MRAAQKGCNTVKIRFIQSRSRDGGIIITRFLDIRGSLILKKGELMSVSKVGTIRHTITKVNACGIAVRRLSRRGRRRVWNDRSVDCVGWSLNWATQVCNPYHSVMIRAKQRVSESLRHLTDKCGVKKPLLDEGNWATTVLSLHKTGGYLPVRT